MILSVSAEIFACHSAACRPPKSGGSGGSGSGMSFRARAIPSAGKMAVVGIPHSTGRTKALTRAGVGRSRAMVRKRMEAEAHLVRTGKWVVPLMERAKKSAPSTVRRAA